MAEFSKYRLKDNPFDIFSYKHEMANRMKEWDSLNKALVSSFRGKGPRFLVLLGDYGMGKTYTLEHVHRWVVEERPDVFVAYGNVLASERLAIQESEPKWGKFGIDLVTRIFDSIGRERLVEVSAKVKLEKFKSKFVKVFEELRDRNEIAFKYVTGQKLWAKDFKELDVDSAIIDSPTSLELLFDFLRVIKLGGYSNFLLLLDEFEYITAVYGETSITKILNTFRQIFDDFGNYEIKYSGQIAKPVFLFAVSPGGWDRLEELQKASIRKTGGGGIAPFMRRIRESDKILLGPFSREDSLELVKMRLSEARVGKVEEALLPFTKGCIEYVHEVSFYKPGDVIKYCGILLEDALEEGLEKIDQNDAQRILQKYGIYAKESKPAKTS